MKKLQRGFTLIEMMITVTIIGILASVALPAYQSFIARSQVIEAVNIITGLKIEFTNGFGNNGQCPVNGVDGFETATYYQGNFVEKVEFGGALASITNSSCSLVATFKNTGTHPGLSGKTIVVAMTLEPDGASQWEMRQSLTQGTTPIVLLPNSLR